ncbi:hypothetical protein [Marinoscillum furvescens]|uniref:hypothetical protein n=1 Tax=Marinoscillum furvescens TaxID=1026 RepID=UPI0011C017DF|nr:hypothetical protein [Marinoscillum furvescens]
MSTDQLTVSASTTSWYDQQIGKELTGVLLGAYYPIQRVSNTTHQFFLTDQWKTGAFKYRGRQYDSVAMMYDIHEDVLVIRHPTSFQFHAQAIRPNQSQIEWFTIGNHFFRYTTDDILIYKEGFVEVLFSGDQIELIAKRVLQKETGTTIEYKAYDRYLLHVGDEYHRIRRKGSVLSLFKAHRKEIKDFIRQNKIRVHPDYELHLLELTRFLEDLLATTPQ